MGIKELELDFSPSRKRFVLSLDLVNAESIQLMKLAKCRFDLPPDSNRLYHLRELILRNVSIRQASIEGIVSNCLMLRTLQLISCNSIHNIKIPAQHLKGFKRLVIRYCSKVSSVSIHAPSLCSLLYHGRNCKFQFWGVFNQLDDAIVNIRPSAFGMLPLSRYMVINLAHVRTLTVSSTFLEGLSADGYGEMISWMSNLKELYLLVAGESVLNPNDIVSLLKKCPAIERVFIDLGNNALENSHFWDFKGRNYLTDCSIVFPRLRSVKVRGFTYRVLPVTMVTFFLKQAINLQHLVLVEAKKHHLPETFAMEWLRQGMSSNAQIEIYRHRRDSSTIMPEHFKDI